MKRCLMLVMLLSVVASSGYGSFGVPLGATRVAAAQTNDARPSGQPIARGPSAPTRPAADPPLDCTSSPYGNLLNMGMEKEFFMAYTRPLDTSNPSYLLYRRFDNTADNTLAAGTSFGPSEIESGPRFGNVKDFDSVVADLNGDGQNEYIQAMRDGNNHYTLFASIRNGSSMFTDTWRGTNTDFLNQSYFAATAGNFTNQVDARAQQIAVASVGTNNIMRVYFWSGAADGSLAQSDNALLANFGYSVSSEDAVFGIAAADVNGDGFDELVIGTYDAKAGSPSEITIRVIRNTNNLWAKISERTINVNGALFPQLAAGDIDGDFKDDVVVAYSKRYPSNERFGDSVNIKTMRYSTNTNALTDYGTFLDNGGFGSTSPLVSGLELAIGDTDRDGLPEPVLAYYNGGPVFVNSFDAEQPVIRSHNRWYTASNSTVVDRIGLDVGDMNKDGLADIGMTYHGRNQKVKVVRLEDQETAETPEERAGFQQRLLLRGEWEDGIARSTLGGLTLDMGDWNNDSIKAAYAPATGSTLRCKRVAEPQISAAVFVPPRWENIQADDAASGSLGESKTKAQSQETEYTSEYTHSVSGYIGGEVDSEVFELGVKVTAGAEFSNSETRGESTEESETISEGVSNNNDFVVFNTTPYNCYSYQMQERSVPTESALRFCGVAGNVSQESPALDSWDRQNSPLFDPEALQWAPVVRDWASLTVFRGANAVQSSTVGEAVAARAVDNVIDGVGTNNSVSTTQSQIAGATAWWQIDLGASQDITKVRVWNRTDNTCAGQPCGPLLKNFYLFASDVDFRTISGANDPNVLKADSRVKTYYKAGSADEVYTFLTINSNLNSIRKRFVRIQLADAGALSLAEVQVMGDNHVEPNRYPVAVKETPNSPGWFLTTMYDPTTKTYKDVRTRGDLNWNGADYNVLKTSVVGPGEGVPEWSLTKEEVTSTTEATSVGNSFSVGAEFDIAAGVGGKATFGAAYSFSGGLTTDTSTTNSWGEGFEIGGSVQGFPNTVDGKSVVWPGQCKYKFQPYYYTMTEQTNYGVQHKFTVVDYIVPFNQANLDGLDRSANLTPCLEGQSSATIGLVSDPASLAFGNQRTNTNSAVKNVTLTNYTASKIRINSVELIGAGKAVFQNGNMCPSELGSFDQCTIPVRFSPTANGAMTAQLKITTDQTTNATKLITLTGTGVSPIATLSTTLLAFGQQQINTASPSQVVTVRNTGNIPLSFSSIKVSAGFTQPARTCTVGTATLAAGASCTINVAFNPTTKGAQTGTLTITDDAGGSPRTVALRGVGASIALSPTALNFGTQVLNTSGTRLVVITNTGTQSLPISAITISGPQAASFTRTASCTSINPGASCTVSVAFKPTTSGPQQATLNIVYNQATASRTVGLMGIGTTLDVTPSTLAFGNQKAGTTSTVKVVTLTNRGGWAISLGAQTMGGAFPANFTRTTTCGSTLAAGASCAISVAFAPKTVGAKTATISIASNAAGNPHVVSLSGNGVQ